MAADEKNVPPEQVAKDSPGSVGKAVSGGFGRLRRVFGTPARAPESRPEPMDARAEILEHTRVVPRSARPVSDLGLVDSLLARLSREPQAADAVLRELGTTFFPIENGWRSLFTRLIQQPNAQPELKRLALEDYRRYLARRETERATGAAPLMSHKPPPPAGTQGFERGEEAPAPHLVRLPTGRPVAVRSPDDLLAKQGVETLKRMASVKEAGVVLALMEDATLALSLRSSLVPALVEWGVPRRDIHFEAFGPTSVRLAQAAPTYSCGTMFTTKHGTPPNSPSARPCKRRARRGSLTSYGRSSQILAAM